MANTDQPPLVAGLRALSDGYRGLLCDVWGVVHDGISAHSAALEALRAFRSAGGKVALLSNAPRPAAAVIAQLDRLKVPRTAYDHVITSGEVARALLAERGAIRVLHVGPERDLPLYDGLPLTLVSEADCELISCTGLVDDTTETPGDYDCDIERWRARKLPMLCANPDLVVERGDQLVWCAGAIADRYRRAGGEATVVGKPYRAIYDMALAALGPEAAPVLALGDGIETDVRGAMDVGIDVVFVTGGIHSSDFGARDLPDIAAVHARLANSGLRARALMARLAP